MPFNILCSFYVNNLNKIKKPQLFLNHIKSEYVWYKLKKERLKLGTIRFEIREYRYKNAVLYYWFEMIFSRQPTSQSKNANFQKILNSFKWSWDFSSVAATVIVASGIYDFLRTIVTQITTQLFPSFTEHLAPDNKVLKESLRLVEPSSTFSIPSFKSSGFIADLCTYFGMHI